MKISDGKYKIKFEVITGENEKPLITKMVARIL